MITITPQAAQKIIETMKDENKDPQKDYLRVFVQGGGCSGFQYGLMLDENGQGQADQIFETSGIKILIDPISIQYLRGAVINYTDNDQGGGFSFNNPNAQSTCGCGQSFNTE